MRYLVGMRYSIEIPDAREDGPWRPEVLDHNLSFALGCPEDERGGLDT